MIHRHDIVLNAKGTIGFREITFWTLWCGVAMMTIASLLTFFGKPKIIWEALTKMGPESSGTRSRGRRQNADGARAHRIAAHRLADWRADNCVLVALMAHSYSLASIIGFRSWLSDLFSSSV